MKPIVYIFTSVICASLLSPGAVFAEDTGTIQPGAQNPPPIMEVPPLVGKPPTKNLPTKPVMPPKQTNGSTHGMMGSTTDPRQNPPVRAMFSSGTQPLPPNMKELMERRDGVQDRMMMEGRMEQNGSETQPVSGKIGDRIGQAKEKMMENRSQQMREFARRTGERIKVAIDRFTTIIKRTESRITKMKAAGIDTSAAETHLKNAKDALDRATTLLQNAKIQIDSLTLPNASSTETSPQPGMGQPSPMREVFKKAGDELRTAQHELTLAVTSLKGLTGVRNEDMSASSSDKLQKRPLPPLRVREASTTESASGATPDGQ